jgi:hypothetical protein
MAIVTVGIDLAKNWLAGLDPEAKLQRRQEQPGWHHAPGGRVPAHAAGPRGKSSTLIFRATSGQCR